MAECKWCGRPESFHCDCVERINCDKAGQVGHQHCGVRACGCPKFTVCDHPECEEQKREEMAANAKDIADEMEARLNRADLEEEFEALFPETTR